MQTLTVGTSGRQYTTLQAAIDAVPATLTEPYVIELYNDSEFTAGGDTTGKTTSAVNYLKIRAAAGQSFQDHANKASNALYYNQANGVAITAAAPVIKINSRYTTVERLQIKCTSQPGSAGVVSIEYFPGSKDDMILRDCIVWTTATASLAIRTGTAANVLFYDSATTASGGIYLYDYGRAINCTSIRVGSAGSVGFSNGSNTNEKVYNCAAFGWATCFSGSWPSIGNYNASSDATAPGTTNYRSLTFSNQVENTTNDFRTKAGSALINAGNTDSTWAPNDIIGTARGATTVGDVGVWEYAATDVQILLPASDITTTGWTSSAGGALYAAIDESVASDTDYIYTGTLNAECEVKLQPGSTPGSGSKNLKVRCPAGFTPVGNWSVSLYQGATLVQAFTSPAPTADSTATFSVTNAITDYSDLRVRIKSTS